jgi:hypothetical protein
MTEPRDPQLQPKAEAAAELLEVKPEVIQDLDVNSEDGDEIVGGVPPRPCQRSTPR